MKFAVSGFAGAIKALQAKLIPSDSIGVDSVNQKPGRGDFRAWRNPLTVATVPSGRSTIYRIGRDVASDTNYWLSWPTTVHAVRGFIDSDPTERTYFTGDGPPKVTDNVIGLATPPYPTAARLLGVPAPTQQPSLTEVTPGAGTAETRFYVYTFVTDQGEESAPSPVSASITCQPGAVITVGNLGGPPVGNYGITLQRVYRTQNAADGATEFFFLREIAIGSTSTTDDGRALGETLATATWGMPPADLKQLHAMWNGIMAGISGRAVRYCEPDAPYAWPPAYETLTPDCTPVALASYQQTLVVLTTGKPTVVGGTSPDALEDKSVEFDQACVSDRGAVGLGHGVGYPSPDGLCYVGSASPPRVLTNGILLKEDWEALRPSTIIGSKYEGAYYGSYDDGTGRKGFFVDPLNPQGIYFVSLGFAALFSDRLQDGMFGLDGVNVRKWDAGADFMTARFRSKVFRAPFKVNMGWAEVVADSFPLTFRMWSSRKNPGTGQMEMVLRKTKVVTSREPFSMPSGYLSDEYQFEIEASAGVAVQGFAVAETVEELRQL